MGTAEFLYMGMKSFLTYLGSHLAIKIFIFWANLAQILSQGTPYGYQNISFGLLNIVPSKQTIN